ncbi:MAG: peroxisome- protein [Piccolia ochrophora]|nr:MAG: peroxisome- protein [Piccolia ochrophora]
MTTPPPQAPDAGNRPANNDTNPPTTAAFSPSTLSHSNSPSKQRSTILVQQKSPLLVATPPQVTRALAYSHPFLLPLNKLAGLLSWTSGDPWESFLLVACFWAVVLYGDVVVRYAGPVALVVGLIVGMYSRRYSPLSSTGWTGEKLSKDNSKQDADNPSTVHHKSLDEIVETLRSFTSRCNVLLAPLLRMTDFLSTQRTATSATTRPSLTKLFIRILFVTPIWVVLALPPLRVITTRRVVLTLGTVILSWHSRPARISRVILWRSATVRRICSVLTGLTYEGPEPTTSKPTSSAPPLPPRASNSKTSSASFTPKRRPGPAGVRFTFILYENQRRWLGLGWNSSLFVYERSPWTDEHLNTAPSKEDFELPEVDGAAAQWRWVDGSDWSVEGAVEGEEGGRKGSKGDPKTSGEGWIYYDNKWRDGRRGVDSWGRYTRRRKWYRDAELVEITPSTESTPNPTSNPEAALSENESSTAVDSDAGTGGGADDDTSSIATTTSRRRRWFRGRSKTSGKSGEDGDDGVTGGGGYAPDPEDADDDAYTGLEARGTRNGDWRVGDDTRMGLG